MSDPESVFLRDAIRAYEEADDALAAWNRETTLRAVERMDATIRELRAVLAPKLDDPWIDDADNVCTECYWCGASDYAPPEVRHPRPPIQHQPGCPVLRKDELLGREP